MTHPADRVGHPGPPLLAGVGTEGQRAIADRRRALFHCPGLAGQRAGQGAGEGPALLGGRRAAERYEVTGLPGLGDGQRGERAGLEVALGQRRAEDGLLLRGLVLHPGQRAERARAGDERGVAAHVGDAIVDREQAGCRRGIAVDHGQRGSLALRRVPAQARQAGDAGQDRGRAGPRLGRVAAAKLENQPAHRGRPAVGDHILPLQGRKARSRPAVRDEHGRVGPLVLHRLR